MGIENEPDIAKKNIYLRLVRGSVIQQLLSADVDQKHPGAVDQALVLQIRLNEDAQHSRLASTGALCDIGSDIASLFMLMKKEGIKVEKDMSPVEARILNAWEASSMLPVIEPLKATA